MTKPFNPLELVARVRSQLRRYTQLGAVSQKKENVYVTGGLTVDDDRKEVCVDGEPVKLTPIEYRILLLLVKNQGRVLSLIHIYFDMWFPPLSLIIDCLKLLYSFLYHIIPVSYTHLDVYKETAPSLCR